MKTVYDFYSPQCAPCRALAPKFKKWSEQYKEVAEFVTIDITGSDEEQEFAASVGVSAVPTVTVTNGENEEVARWVGIPKEKDFAEVMKEE